MTTGKSYKKSLNLCFSFGKLEPEVLKTFFFLRHRQKRTTSWTVCTCQVNSQRVYHLRARPEPTRVDHIAMPRSNGRLSALLVYIKTNPKKNLPGLTNILACFVSPSVKKKRRFITIVVTLTSILRPLNSAPFSAAIAFSASSVFSN
jgi:hypothetical protein